LPVRQEQIFSSQKIGNGEIMRALLTSLWSDDDGQDLAEYGLLLFMIAVLIVTALTAFRGQISTLFSNATSILGG
jgi:Flp pilus assembly pilin Flp